jgi:hypothetical protein
VVQFSFAELGVFYIYIFRRTARTQSTIGQWYVHLIRIQLIYGSEKERKGTERNGRTMRGFQRQAELCRNASRAVLAEQEQEQAV